MRIILWLIKIIGVSAAVWTIVVSAYITITPATRHGVSYTYLADGTQTQETYTTSTRDPWIFVALLVPLLNKDKKSNNAIVSSKHA